MSALLRLPLKSVTLAFAATALLGACSPVNSDDDKVNEAISCLDNAKTQADATACIAKVEGVESTKAYLLRCSANFVAQGFVGQRIVDAFKTLDDSGTTGNAQTAQMMSFFIFPVTDPLHSAATTLKNCEKSKVTGMIQIASAAKTATLLAQAIGGGSSIPAYLNPADPTFDPSKLEDELNSGGTALLNTMDKEELGATAIVAQASFCGAGSAYASDSICTTLNDAVASGDPATIGEELYKLLAGIP